MTEEEKIRDRQCKEAVSAELARMLPDLAVRYRHALDDTDPRITQYALEVAGNPDGHNLYEQLGVRRFFDMLDRYDWKRGRVQTFFRFYESLRFNGMSGRTRYRLTPVQAFQFANLFGFADAQGRRLIHTAYIFVPRKFSKTTSAASLAVYDMLFGDNNAQAYVGANSYEQAKICFDEIRAIMRDIDPSGRHFRVNREKITFQGRGRDSLIRCLTANAKTQDGLHASLVIMDEYAQARNTAGKNGADLKNVLTSSMGPRREPLTLIITTASEVLDGPFAHELDGVMRVLRGEATSDRVFASLFLPDADDDEGDPRTWAKVQPHLGITVQPDYYEREWESAQLSAENMLVFRTKLLNVFAGNEQRSWISSALAGNMSRPMRLENFTGRPDAMMAIDLSESDDFSAVTTGIYDTGRREFHFHTSYFFPSGALAGHPNEQLYRTWAAKGHLILTDGDVIDYRRIVEYVLEVNRHVQILGIGYDQWKSQELINMLSAAGAANVLTAVKQTYGNFTAPVESFEHGAKTGRIFINDNPINAYCFGNAVLDFDRLENCKPVKRKQSQKIDGVVTMLMCMRLFIDYIR
jgi:phage terminase large subunit-like protein